MKKILTILIVLGAGAAIAATINKKPEDPATPGDTPQPTPTPGTGTTPQSPIPDSMNTNQGSDAVGVNTGVVPPMYPWPDGSYKNIPFTPVANQLPSPPAPPTPFNQGPLPPATSGNPVNVAMAGFTLMN